MPHMELTHRFQKAVLWIKIGDSDFSEPVLDSPVEIDVRWEEKQEEAIDPKGDVVGLTAKVVVDRDIPIGSVIWQGSLNEWYGTGSEGEDSDLRQVITFSKIPDIKNRGIRRVVGLVRFRGDLPT